MEKTLRQIGFLLVIVASLNLGACGGGGGSDVDSSANTQTTSSAAQPHLAESIDNGDGAYDVTLLGELGTDNQAVAINDAGQVVGHYCSPSGGRNVFFWSNGTMRHLVESARVTDINRTGEIVGWMEKGSTSEAFVYADQLYYFDLPPGASRAYGIDDEGCVVGRCYAKSENSFFDADGETRILVPEVFGYATDISASKQILIKVLRQDGFHSLLLDSEGTLVDLGSLGAQNTQAEDLNNYGQVVGWSQTRSGQYHAFLWENGEMIDLSRPGWSFSSALAINDSGQILLKASTAKGTLITLWDDGEYTDLNHLGLDYVEVTDMNNQGQIIGWTTNDDGFFRAFLATPL